MLVFSKLTSPREFDWKELHFGIMRISFQHQFYQLYLLRSEFQLDKLPQVDGEEGAGTEGRRKNCGKVKTCGYELVFNCSGKFLIREKSDHILRYGETS